MRRCSRPRRRLAAKASGRVLGWRVTGVSCMAGMVGDGDDVGKSVAGRGGRIDDGGWQGKTAAHPDTVLDSPPSVRRQPCDPGPATRSGSLAPDGRRGRGLGSGAALIFSPSRRFPRPCQPALPLGWLAQPTLSSPLSLLLASPGEGDRSVWWCGGNWTGVLSGAWPLAARPPLPPGRFKNRVKMRPGKQRRSGQA